MDILATQAAPHGEVQEHSNRLPEIELLRAVAILMVLIGHAAMILVFWPSHFVATYLSQTGLGAGVDLFFAISGFVIARSLLPRLANVTDSLTFTRVALDFWIARAWRLLPSAWLWLTAPLFLSLVFNHSHAYGPFSANWSMFVAGMLDMANFYLAGTVLAPPGAAFPQWSLSLEEQFYIMLPFAAFFCRRYLVLGLSLIALAGFFVPNTAFVSVIRLWPVAFGVLLAIWAQHPSYRECAPAPLARSAIARWMLLILLVAFLMSVGSPALHIVPFHQGAVALVSAMLVWFASYGGNFLCGPGLFRRGAEIIAARSYSLYLIHISVYCGIREIWWRGHRQHMPSYLQAAELLIAAVLLLIIITELNHRYLEKPLRAHGKMLVARRRAARAPAL